MPRTRGGQPSDDDESCRQQEPDTSASGLRTIGRPREINGPGTSLSVWLPVAAYDWLAREAERRRMSVSAYVREVLVLLANVRGA